MSEIRYEAFISYRHLPPDTQAALQIEKALESYKIPRALRKKAGRARLRKCFRDRDELPLSDDLGESIDAALSRSDWLIVVCTPELPKSKWCLREIDRFIETGRRDKIIPVLLEGEPEDSYPRQLRFAQRDGQQVEVEPLSADLRADRAGGMRKKLRVEKLRIAARILGVGFDDLRRRQRERRMKLALGISAAAAALLLMFLAYAFVQNGRIERQRVLAATSESGLLIEKSLLYIQQDRRAEARQLALEAYGVSQTIGGANRQEALRALAAASYAGDFDTAAVLENTGMLLHAQAFSPDDRFVASVAGRTNVMCFRADTGEALWLAPLDGTGFSALSYSPDGSKLLAIGSNGDRAFVLDAQDGSLLYASDSGAADGAAFFADDDSAVLMTADSALRWSFADGTMESAFDFASVAWPRWLNESIAGAPQLLTWMSHDGSGELVIGDLRTGRLTLYQTGVERGVAAVGFSAALDAVAVNLTGVLSVLDLATGEVRWSQTAENNASLAPLWLDGGLVLFAGTAYDAQTGEQRYTLKAQAGDDGSFYGLVSMDAVEDPSGAYVMLRGTYYRADDGSLVCSLPEDQIILAVSHGGDTLLAGSTGADFTLVHALGKGTQTFEPAYAGELFKVETWNALKGSGGGIVTLTEDPAYAAGSSFLQQLMFITPDGRFAVVANKYDYTAIYDMDSGTSVSSRLYGQSAGVTDAAFTADSGRMALAGYTGMITVYDLPLRRTVQTMTDDYGRQSLRAITFNPGGDLVMAENHNGTQYLVYSVENGALLYRMHAVSETADFGFDTQTGNAVVLYKDGSATVARIFQNEAELLAFAAGQ